MSHNLFMVMFKDFELNGWTAVRVQENFMYFIHDDPQDISEEEVSLMRVFGVYSTQNSISSPQEDACEIPVPK